MIKAESGSLLYIIISIIVLIVSAFSKKNQKEGKNWSDDPQHHPHPQETANEPPWAKEWGDIFGKVLQNEPYPQKTEKPPAPLYHEDTAERIKTEDHLSEQEREKEKRKVAHQHNSKITTKDHNNHVAMLWDEEEASGSIFHPEEFELERAVIYNAILEPKYF